MPGWFVPVLKAVLPHVGTIVSASVPAFTKRKAAEPVDQTRLLQQQIEELQTAAAQNATHLRDLAEQLQRTVSAIEQAGAAADAKVRRLQTLATAALAAAGVALVVALAVAFGS